MSTRRREIKQAVTGTGAATKEQVQHMVISMLRLDGSPSPDAADALAAALCHGQPAPAAAKQLSGQARRWRAADDWLNLRGRLTLKQAPHLID